MSEQPEIPKPSYKECPWCGMETNRVVKHHFPIPKAKGGKEVVSICLDCHDKAHGRLILDASDAVNHEEYQELVTRRFYARLEKSFPKLRFGKLSIIRDGITLLIIQPPWMVK